MERHEFNKFHLGMIIVSLVGIATIIWAIFAIHETKNRETEEAKKNVEKPAIVEEIMEEPEIVELPDGIKEPDFTFEEFEIEKNRVQLNNENRYIAEEMDEIINNLAKEFLPPIEREDILDLAHKIDDATDLIEEILINTYIFGIEKFREDTLQMANILVDCCKAEIELLKEFKNFRKSKEIKNLVIKINMLESESDELYKKAMKKLYEEQKDAVEIMKWTTIYNCLEDCIDLCEEIANEVENVVLKNL